MIIDTLRSLRTKESFGTKLLQWQGQLILMLPHLPRGRKAPKRYEYGLTSSDFRDTQKAFPRQLYYEAIAL